jgi:hypothetical protein
LVDVAAPLWRRGHDVLGRRGEASEEKRSRTGWAVAIAALVYATVGILILGADLITRRLPRLRCHPEAMIVLVLVGVLGWALWLFSPRRRARRRRLQ